MEIWIFLFVVVVVIAWWLIRRNANMTKGEQPVDTHTEIHEPDLSVEPVHVEESAPLIEEREDDLILIEGIGPKINDILKQSEIRTFKQLSETKPEELQNILHQAGNRLGDPASWPEQARLAAEGKFDELQKYQDSLKAGRIE